MLPPAFVFFTTSTGVEVSTIENKKMFVNLNWQRGDLEIATSVGRINLDRVEDLWKVQYHHNQL
jgi:hypothetical protein